MSTTLHPLYAYGASLPRYWNPKYATDDNNDDDVVRFI